MVDHVAKLGCLDVAAETLEELVCAASCLLDHELLNEAHVASVAAVPVSDALLDHLLDGPLLSWLSLVSTNLQLRTLAGDFLLAALLQA